MSTTLKIRNITQSPQSVNALSGRVVIQPGQTLDDENIMFADGEATSITANKAVFQVGDEIITSGSIKTSDLNIGVIAERDALTRSLGNSQAEVLRLTADIKALTAERDALNSGNAAILEALGVKEGVLDEIGRLKSNAETHEKFWNEVRDKLGLGDGEGIIEAIEELMNEPATETRQTMTLEQAVASLDDDNPEHWTEGGKPSMAALESLTGGNPKRADVDALPNPRTRVKK